jgi:alanyl-tRNA synthetase
MKTQAIRQKFTEFFEKNNHKNISSSSLIPQDDPTLLFVNSGMVQFKNVFLGHEPRDYTRATSIQRCVRAGGKHNDLDNVGFTARHHTFFEMLGNFSFGDYFKREAINFAWTFLTQELKLPASKLWVTIFEEDQEAADIWLKELKIDPTRFSRIGAKDNFWAMGDTGPCGPCTEIFYDHGPEIAGGPPGSPDADGDRYIEIWNLVFMQFNRDKSGNLTPLPKPCVDTGMGLERLAAVMQGVHDNYHIDIFNQLIDFIAKLTSSSDLSNRSLRVIADHIRSTAFLILDGVNPSNEGRGYVLRRIMRRGIRHGHKLGATDLFFHKIIAPLCDIMGEAYPDLIKEKSRIIDVIAAEETQFLKTLSQGVKEFEAAISNPSNIQNKTLSGEILFKLYDTYGFPADLTEDMAKERGLSVDHMGFESCMNQQRARAKEANNFGLDYNAGISTHAKSEFKGYFSSTENTEIFEIFEDSKQVSHLSQGQKGALVLVKTPFYAESGGQIGDKGWIRTEEGGVFEVLDTQKKGEAIIHFGQVVQGSLATHQLVKAEIDLASREEIRRHHSATHLLHAALQKIGGNQITQKGSLVTSSRLRFDFSSQRPFSQEELNKIENLVNQAVLQNYDVRIIETSQSEAKKMGAMALFGEKYGDSVRVIQMGDVSMELCGGTHVSHTGDIGLFKIISESAVASGIRRIEAVAGKSALNYFQEIEKTLRLCADLLKAPFSQISEKLLSLVEKNNLLNKQLDSLEKALALSHCDALFKQSEKIKDINFLAQEVKIDPKNLKDLALSLQAKMGSGVIVLGCVHEAKVNIMALVSADLTHRYNAGKLISTISETIGGKGGGKAEMAQAGGVLIDQLSPALNQAREWVKNIN